MLEEGICYSDPQDWKAKHGVNHLRKISCSLLASKMYESYVLDWLKGKDNLKQTNTAELKDWVPSMC